MSKKSTLNEFIEKSNLVHNNKYDYSKVEYINNRTKVCIICPEHGEFYQSPYKHLSGQGCPNCSKTKKSNLSEFINKARNVHGDKYDYSKSLYVNKEEKLCITCPSHGDFWQTPHNHLKGQGCPVCGKNKTKPVKYTTEEFISKAKEIHGDKYDYSDSVYVNMNTNVKITCPSHGIFWQNPYLHINGSICPKCSREIGGMNRRLSLEEFVSKAKEIHGDKYDYSQVNYITAKDKVGIICPTHGLFFQTPDKHLCGCGCDKCSHTISKNEQEIYDFICTLIGKEKVIQSDRTLLNGKELDIYIPSLKIAIEYNGLYWHTLDTHSDKNYHLNKTLLANEKGVKLIQIFEDEYVHNKEIVLQKISHILNCNSNMKIGGRKCDVREIETDTAKEFLNTYHIQGFAASTIYLGAFFNDNLISVMSFKKTKDEWELTRFASDYNYTLQGVGGKMFTFFVKKYGPLLVKSFADRRWTINEDNLYTKLGFSKDSYTHPEYRYYKPQDGLFRWHKFGFRKEILHRKYSLPLSMTESEMTNHLGYSKIYDCGLIKYVWKKRG